MKILAAIRNEEPESSCTGKKSQVLGFYDNVVNIKSGLLFDRPVFGEAEGFGHPGSRRAPLLDDGDWGDLGAKLPGSPGCS